MALVLAAGLSADFSVAFSELFFSDFFAALTFLLTLRDVALAFFAGAAGSPIVALLAALLTGFSALAGFSALVGVDDLDFGVDSAPLSAVAFVFLTALGFLTADVVSGGDETV